MGRWFLIEDATVFDSLQLRVFQKNWFIYNEEEEWLFFCPLLQCC